MGRPTQNQTRQVPMTTPLRTSRPRARAQQAARVLLHHPDPLPAMEAEAEGVEKATVTSESDGVKAESLKRRTDVRKGNLSV